LRRLGDEHLAAVRGGADPCGAMDGQARVHIPGGDGVAGVNTDPDSDRRTGRPLMPGQRPLDVKRAQHGLLCPGEGDEERVSLRIHLMTAMAGDGGADQAPVLGKDPRVALAQRLDQPR
jgi:hypothetical protein